MRFIDFGVIIKRHTNYLVETVHAGHRGLEDGIMKTIEWFTKEENFKSFKPHYITSEQ